MMLPKLERLTKLAEAIESLEKMAASNETWGTAPSCRGERYRYANLFPELAEKYRRKAKLQRRAIARLQRVFDRLAATVRYNPACQNAQAA